MEKFGALQALKIAVPLGENRVKKEIIRCQLG
jgi:hypothetical protein